jgi:EAL domain-containing protein (putative c-di-GMP-specific phosphodiesterase class I)
MPNLYVSSNFDCSQFFDKSMPGFVARLLKIVKLAPQCLILELTERGLLDDADLIQKNMQALKKIGVRLALDDFGTGYSSLSYLYRYPIDILKIDRSFITNIEHHASNKAIVKTIVDLADNLNMITIAEGIESDYEAKYLKQLSAAFGQGYHYSKPVSAGQAQILIQRQQA